MEDAKKWSKWSFAALFIFILLGVSSILFFTDPDEIPYSLTGEVKKVIINMVTRTWPSSSPNEIATAAEQNKKPEHFVLSPNLTTCHRSLTDADRPIYCCPPKRESEEPVIDFQFPSTSSPIRVRRPAHLLDDDYIGKYKKALSIMKSLPYDDPRSFLRQANIHCVYCSGAYNQLHSNFVLKIHRSWLFFPWHRMMLYFHERILGSLINDDTFALPFWNWDNPEGMLIPDVYMNGPFFDNQRDTSHFPPEVADINFDYVERGLGPEDQIETNVAFMYHQMVSGAKKTELFMGCPYKAGEEGFCDGPGTIELAPHNALHTWVGSSENPEREHLGAFYSAAKDPVFYAHHSNIDRLWEVYRGLNGEKAEIKDPDWLNSYFYFHDENSQNIRVKVSDVLDITKLGYTYERRDNPWLTARPKPSVPPKLARPILKMRDNQNELQGAKQTLTTYFGPEGRALDTNTRIRVSRPQTRRTQEEKDEEEEILVIYGIEVKRDTYVKFDVFVNAIDETTIGPESREFAGTFVNMRRGVRIVKNKDDRVPMTKTNLKLGISELLEDLEADGDESIWVTLVPRGGTCINTTVGGVRIEYMR